MALVLSYLSCIHIHVFLYNKHSKRDTAMKGFMSFKLKWKTKKNSKYRKREEGFPSHVHSDRIVHGIIHRFWPLEMNFI